MGVVSTDGFKLDAVRAQFVSSLGTATLAKLRAHASPQLFETDALVAWAGAGCCTDSPDPVAVESARAGQFCRRVARLLGLAWCWFGGALDGLLR